MLIIKGNK